MHDFFLLIGILLYPYIVHFFLLFLLSLASLSFLLFQIRRKHCKHCYTIFWICWWSKSRAQWNFWKSSEGYNSFGQPNTWHFERYKFVWLMRSKHLLYFDFDFWRWLCCEVVWHSCSLQYLSNLLLNVLSDGTFITDSGRLFLNLAILTVKLYFSNFFNLNIKWREKKIRRHFMY